MRSKDSARRDIAALLPALSLALLLSACGGDSSSVAGSSDSRLTPAGTSLSGTVAVGAPITNGTLRVLDANGDVVASGITIDANGNYAGVELTGPAPYRIEACGYAGPNYLCVYSVARGAGTANVTPLTTATVLLATGESPDSLMSGTAPGLTDSSVDAAQAQLRQSLSAVLTDSGVASDFDFVSGSLSAGSRTGYDRVLDSVGVSTGEDTQPFVQITPRLGTGNLYLEPGNTSGSLTVSGGAANLSLAGLETLFRNMSNALTSEEACTNAETGLRPLMATHARMNMDEDMSIEGGNAVADGLCSFFAHGEGDAPMWGARLMSPTLGRCDLTGNTPICRISFVLQDPDGNVKPVGQRMGVAQENGAWKFYGDLDPIQLHASARVQRDRRIDGVTPVDTYMRALAFEAPALSGLNCVRVSQHDADGHTVTIGYYKPHPGAMNQKRLSLWTDGQGGMAASLDPTTGATRNADDTWIGLPDGSAGDAVIRNFYRGGRSVVFSLYSNSACSTAYTVDGRSDFEVEVEGVPPLSSTLASISWPELDSASTNSLRNLTLAAQATGIYSAAWTFGRGTLGIDGVTFCSDRAECGDGGAGRIGERDIRPGALSVTVPLQNGVNSVAANAAKMLALYGRTGDGLGVQSNFLSCPLTQSGQICQ